MTVLINGGNLMFLDEPTTLIETLVPDVVASTLEPEVQTTGQKPPEFDVLVIDPAPEVEAETPLPPAFAITPVSTPVPTAAAKGDSKAPEVKIRPVTDLKPKIVKGDD